MPFRPIRLLVVTSTLSLLLAACYGGEGYNDYGQGPSAPGGATSVDEYGPGAFSQPAANLSDAEVARFRIGDVFFTSPWSAAPGVSPESDGLGPTYLATSCAACHVADGRGSMPGTAGDGGMGIVRFADANGRAADLTDYHLQIQPRAIEGVPTEASFEITWIEEPGSYPDGETYVLRRPVLEVLADDDTLVAAAADGVRIAPPLLGVGLLEAIPEEAVRALADPEDADGDGVSGRVNEITDASGSVVMGRFGLKANVATIAEQAAVAYLLDMGITSTMLPDENCPIAQVACGAAPSGGEPEISASRFADVVFYTATLAPPSRPFADDESVVAGERVFGELGCVACHVQRFETGDHEIAALSGQTIYPYTDLLLHDMGAGLSDGRTDGAASATEWRTPALWGLGLTRTVNASAGFLHDGRARSIEEAILWHGGEAEASRDAFMRLSAENRHLVLVFLKSL